MAGGCDSFLYDLCSWRCQISDRYVGCQIATMEVHFGFLIVVKSLQRCWPVKFGVIVEVWNGA